MQKSDVLNSIELPEELLKWYDLQMKIINIYDDDINSLVHEVSTEFDSDEIIDVVKMFFKICSINPQNIKLYEKAVTSIALNSKTQLDIVNFIEIHPFLAFKLFKNGVFKCNIKELTKISVIFQRIYSLNQRGIEMESSYKPGTSSDYLAADNLAEFEKCYTPRNINNETKFNLSDFDFPSLNSSISYLSAAALYRSRNIFSFLLSKGFVINNETLEYAVRGGDDMIIDQIVSHNDRFKSMLTDHLSKIAGDWLRESYVYDDSAESSFNIKLIYRNLKKINNDYFIEIANEGFVYIIKYIVDKRSLFKSLITTNISDHIAHKGSTCLKVMDFISKFGRANVEKNESNNPKISYESECISYDEWFNKTQHNVPYKQKPLKIYTTDEELVLTNLETLPKQEFNLNKILSTPQNMEIVKKSKLSGIIHNYNDLYYIGDEISDIRQQSALHVINHVFESIYIKKNRLSGSRDSGFTPTIILVLCPTRNMAYKFVSQILSFLPDNIEVEHLDKFNESFYVEIPPKEAIKKPMDWVEWFGGSNDQNFKTGIRVFEGKISLCQKISKSEIVITSSLSAVLHDDHDFLSSIEVAVIDSLDMTEMANMERTSELFNHLNRKPRDIKATDWSRLRSYFADGLHNQVRQTIGYSTILTPECLNLYLSFRNERGLVITRPISYPRILDTQFNEFYRLNVSSPKDIPGAYIELFDRFLVPKIKGWRADPGDKRTIILFQASRLFYGPRKELESASVDYLELGDEATPADTKNMRAGFHRDKNALLIMTERYYFYNRTKFNHIDQVVFFGTPLFPQTVLELGSKCKTIFYYTKYDSYQLERIVGSSFYKHLLNDRSYNFQY